MARPRLYASSIFGHALGYFHEQGRFDRDKYINIETINIHSAFLNQFTKQTPEVMKTFDVEYDPGGRQLAGQENAQLSRLRSPLRSIQLFVYRQ